MRTLAGATSTTNFDTFAALSAIQAGNTANAPLTRLDPADPNAFWLPSHSYSYSLAPVDTLEARTALREHVIANAGAGKL